jgi:hypothetical protein
MAEKLRHSLEKLRAAADITHALAAQIVELLELREAVQKAEDVKTGKRPTQRHREIISPAYRAQADAAEIDAQSRRRLAGKRDNQVLAGASSSISLERPYVVRTKNSKTRTLPGRLFMQSQWR